MCYVNLQVIAHLPLLTQLADVIVKHLLSSLQFETDGRAIQAYISYILSSLPSHVVSLSRWLTSLLRTRRFVSTLLLRNANLYVLFMRAFISAISKAPLSKAESEGFLREGIVSFLALPLPPAFPSHLMHLRNELESFALRTKPESMVDKAELIALLRQAARASDASSCFVEYVFSPFHQCGQ